MTLPAALKRMPGARWSGILLTGLAATCCLAVLYVAQPGILQRMDLRIYDALLPLRKQAAPSPVPVIIDIDEESLDAFGQWPWPRYLLADLLAGLTEQKVAAIGVDILLPEPDRASPDRVAEHLLRDRDVSLTYNGLPAALRDYDQLLAAALEDAPAVLGAYARYDGTQPSASLPPPPGLVTRSSPGAAPIRAALPSAGNALLPLAVLQQAAPVGFINAAMDADGILRRTPLISLVGDAIYPSLALRTLMRALDKDTLIAFTGPEGLRALRVDRFSIPVAPDGSMLVPFQGGRHTYKYVSAKKILQKTLPPDSLRGGIAFVGTSASGLVDIRATPFDRFFPGVEIHAAALDALLNGNSVLQPGWTPGAQLFAIVLSGLAAILVFGFSRPVIYVPAACILIAVPVLLSRYAFLKGLFLSPLYAILTVGAVGGSLLMLRFYQEEKQKMLLRATFSRYVSPEVVKKITRHQGDLFAGEERELSILFSDIRSFTAISEKLNPRQIVQLLNRYFTPMTSIVRDSEGTLDKFIGDALMAFWNAPLAVRNHPALAVDAALSMQEQLLHLNDTLEMEFGLRLRIGVGVHTGNVYVGNMGSDALINYTLIGDNVNLASRLEGLCPVYGVPVVISGETRERCSGAFAFQFLDSIRVKGKDLPVEIFTPMRTASHAARQEELLAWEAARSLYRPGSFAEAHEAFRALEQQYPGTGLYTVYAERSASLAATPPAGWDGVWVMKGK